MAGFLMDKRHCPAIRGLADHRSKSANAIHASQTLEWVEIPPWSNRVELESGDRDRDAMQLAYPTQARRRNHGGCGCDFIV
jgi:hypothetical protein